MRNKNIMMLLGSLIAIVLIASMQAIAAGEFKFDIATQVAGKDNYTKHWSNVYPPDKDVSIVIYSYAGNMSFKRMSAVSFVFVVFDPLDNIVAVDKIDSFQRNYEPAVAYYTLHPGPDWIEGTYKVNSIVYDRLDRQAWENMSTDPFGIAANIETYKKFYETGSNAGDLGFLKSLGTPVSQAVLNFQINKSASLYPPDRFLVHDIGFIDGSTERILGETLKIEVKVDNNYKDDGAFKLVLLVDNNIVSTQEVTVKGLETATVTFDAKAGKVGTFKLHFGADIPDVKYRAAELEFSITNSTGSTRLETPLIEITGMNTNKEFVNSSEDIIVSVTAVNKGKAGNKTITVYSNKVPVGSAEINIESLDEKTIEIPVNLKNTGLNKISVSDAPQLYRNVFVQEPESMLKGNPIVKRMGENPLKVSGVVVFLVFAGVLYYTRKRLWEDEREVKNMAQGVDKNSGILNELNNKIKNLRNNMKK